MDSTALPRSYLDDTLLAVLKNRQDPIKMVQALLFRGANPNTKHGSGYTALMFACEAGHTGTAKLLISHLDVSALNDYDKEGNTALMIAADFGHELIVAALINAGANLYQQNIYLEDALEFATKGGEAASNEVAFQLFSAMSPYERHDAPYKGLLSYRLFRIPASHENAQALIRYEISVAELHQTIMNFSAGINSAQNTPNNLSRNAELLVLIAEYLFDKCLVHGYVRQEVLNVVEALAPRPSMMFSVCHSRAFNRARNLASTMVDSTIRSFIHAASIPSAIPCSVLAIEDKCAKQDPSKKARK